MRGQALYQIATWHDELANFTEHTVKIWHKYVNKMAGSSCQNQVIPVDRRCVYHILISVQEDWIAPIQNQLSLIILFFYRAFLVCWPSTSTSTYKLICFVYKLLSSWSCSHSVQKPNLCQARVKYAHVCMCKLIACKYLHMYCMYMHVINIFFFVCISLSIVARICVNKMRLKSLLPSLRLKYVMCCYFYCLSNCW